MLLMVLIETCFAVGIGSESFDSQSTAASTRYARRRSYAFRSAPNYRYTRERTGTPTACVGKLIVRTSYALVNSNKDAAYVVCALRVAMSERGEDRTECGARMLNRYGSHEQIPILAVAGSLRTGAS